MDTKIEIKEEDPLSDNVVSQNDSEFFAMKTNSYAVFLDDDCEMAMKTEIKYETPFQDLCSQKERECFMIHHLKQIKSETITSSNNCNMDTKTEIGLEKEREFLPEDPLMNINKHKRDHEMDNKIEIKEEPWCLETETSTVCNDIKDGNFTPIKLPRFHTEAISRIDDFPAPSATIARKNTCLSDVKDYPEYKSQENSITKVIPMEKHVHSASSGKYSDGEAYSMALLIHNGEKAHKCEICDKRFSRLESLKLHNWIHNGKKPHKCTICEKSFTRLAGLKLHNLIHEGKKPHKCEVCDKRFTLLGGLKSHNLIHEGKKPHKCSICEINFTRLSQLKSHNLIHEGKKSHRCEICDKRFTHLSTLKSHNLIHEGKKPHKCKICERSFTQLSNLKSHNLIHEGIRAHNCEACEKRFTRSSDLRRHTLVHHGKKLD